MTYLVNKTDGTAIQILDGTSNVTATSLTLIGRLATNYGESQNENFVHLLENFAYTLAPLFPIKGQVWYDTTVNILKIYSGSAWSPVGSYIVGNVELTGNLFIGTNSFQIGDVGGNASITNRVLNGNVSIYGNVAGIPTRALHISGSSGLLEVSANAVTNFGVMTKIDFDSQLIKSGQSFNTAILSNVNAANLATITSNINMKSYVDAGFSLSTANAAIQSTQITATNSAIVVANTALKNYTDNQITSANVAVASYSKDYADTLNVAMVGNVAVTNQAIITANVGMKAYVDALGTSVKSGLNGLNDKADKVSPLFSGVPTAPTAAFGTNTLQIATTQYVMNRAPFWDGSRKFVSASNPTSGDGDNGDIWFKYS